MTTPARHEAAQGEIVNDLEKAPPQSSGEHGNGLVPCSVDYFYVCGFFTLKNDAVAEVKVCSPVSDRCAVERHFHCIVPPDKSIPVIVTAVKY